MLRRPTSREGENDDLGIRLDGDAHLLAMCTHAILIREDSNGVHSELMGRAEDSDRDFLDKTRDRNSY